MDLRPDFALNVEIIIIIFIIIIIIILVAPAAHGSSQARD